MRLTDSTLAESARLVGGVEVEESAFDDDEVAASAVIVLNSDSADAERGKDFRAEARRVVDMVSRMKENMRCDASGGGGVVVDMWSGQVRIGRGAASQGCNPCLAAARWTEEATGKRGDPGAAIVSVCVEWKC